MTRSVDNINLVAVIKNSGLLRGNSDSPLVLLIARVHNEMLGHFGLIVAKSIGLLQKTIDERGFAVVDVGDDGDVTNFI